MISNPHGATFFAALNTHRGFVSYFREIFDKVETVYVIKGGSGTGKSRFMREVSAEARARGYPVEEFLCSSDPGSLDGIIIDRLGIAVLDGTAPHIHEPTLIGAREKFVDLSVFLDSLLLKSRKSEIERLIAQKSERYAEIYEYLKIVSIYDGIVRKTVFSVLDLEKMEKSVKKSLLWLGKSEKYEKRIRIRSAISCDGHIVLNTYAKKAKKCFALSDLCGLGNIYLAHLLSETEKAKISVEISYDPFAPDTPDALYYPDSGVAFYIGSEGDYEESTVNMRRFVDDDMLRPHKPEIRAIMRLRRDILEQMNYSFALIKNHHASLESIYSAAMRFEDKERLTRDFISKIFPK